MTSYGRVARLTALALATGTLVAAGSGTAGASAIDTTNTFKALGGGSVLRLTINLPVEVPGIGQTLTQDLVLTGGNTLSGANPAAIANSVLGANGTVPLISDLIEKSVTAEYGKPAPAPVNAFPSQLAALGIKGELLALTSTVANPNVDGVISHGHSAVADLRIDGAGNLQAMINALTTQLQAVVNQVLGGGLALPTGTAPSVAGATLPVASTVTGALDTLTAALPAIAQDALGTDQLTDQVEAALAQVTSLLDSLPSAIANQLKIATSADTSLLHVGLIESEEVVSRNAGVVTSNVKNVLTDISALGGLITIEGLSSQATAALGNGVSKAAPKAVGSSSLLKLHAADLLDVDIASDLTATLGSGVLPKEVTDAVQGVLNQITGVLNSVLGATLTGPKVDENVETPNRAASSVAAAHFVVNPSLLGAPLFAKPLIDIALVPAKAEVVRGQAAVPPTVVNTPSTRETLPRTGAELPLTGATAVALMGLAVVARRRRIAHLEG
jgi:hypothetical protein